jgi:predicted enzyme related to lactoylglutathione lyase
MGAPVVWFEIAGRNLEGLERFYGSLFGWKVNVDGPMQYGMVDTGATGGIPGGIYAPGAEIGEYVTFYAQVDDLEVALRSVEELGGTVVQQPMAIGDGTRIASLLDPEGHRIGLIQPGADATTP